MTETAALRILHIVAAEEGPGAVNQALAVMEGLAKMGHTQELMAAPEEAIAAAAAGHGIAVTPLVLPDIKQLSRGFDLVHAHDSRAHSIAAATARVPVIVSRHLATPITRGPAVRWKFRRAAHFIAGSPEIESLLLGAGVAPERVTVICDGADAAQRAEATLGVYRKVLEPPQPEISSS